MQEIVQGKGSVFATHVDGLLLSSYLEHVTCPLNLLDARFRLTPTRQHEKVFTSEKILWLTEVYQIYTECSTGLWIFSWHWSAWWTSNFWKVLRAVFHLAFQPIGLMQLKDFFLHKISPTSPTETTKTSKVSHIFAKICWFRKHPRETWLPSLLNSDFDPSGPSVFIPVSCIQRRCAVAYDKVQFD